MQPVQGVREAPAVQGAREEPAAQVTREVPAVQGPKEDRPLWPCYGSHGGQGGADVRVIMKSSMFFGLSSGAKADTGEHTRVDSGKHNGADSGEHTGVDSGADSEEHTGADSEEHTETNIMKGVCFYGVVLMRVIAGRCGRLWSVCRWKPARMMGNVFQR